MSASHGVNNMIQRSRPFRALDRPSVRLETREFILVVALSFASAVAVSALSAAQAANGATQRYWYAGQSTTSNWRGVAGYVLGFSTNLIDPDHQSVSEWIGLTYSDTANAAQSEWVQIGKFQSSVPPLYSPNGVKLFFENQACRGGIYRTRNLGTPDAVNSKVVVDRSGGSFSYCGNGDSAWPYAFRLDSVTASPVGTGYMRVGGADAEAELEVYDDTGSIRAAISRTDFGLNDNHNISNTYGLHIKNSSGWALWSSTNAASTRCHNYSPLDYVHDRRWDAFHANDDADNTCTDGT